MKKQLITDNMNLAFLATRIDALHFFKKIDESEKNCLFDLISEIGDDFNKLAKSKEKKERRYDPEEEEEIEKSCDEEETIQQDINHIMQIFTRIKSKIE